MTVTSPMEGITASARRATTPPPPLETFLPEEPLLASRRQDGWTAAAQRTFLEAIAEGHGVEVACARVGLSTASAYAYRRTAKGAAFALGWRAATLVARDAIAETLLSARSPDRSTRSSAARPSSPATATTTASP